MNSVYSNAMGGSIANYDKAANRLRDRLSQEAGAQKQSIRDNSYRSGFASQMNNQMAGVDRNRMYNYGQGLADLEDKFEQSRLEGLGIANQSMGQLANYLQGNEQMKMNDSQFKAGLDNTQWQFLNKLMSDIQMGNFNQMSENGQAFLDAIMQGAGIQGDFITNIMKLFGE
jgi:hypothetical protein